MSLFGKQEVHIYFHGTPGAISVIQQKLDDILEFLGSPDAIAKIREASAKLKGSTDQLEEEIKKHEASQDKPVDERDRSTRRR